jgi:hypothetical protein
LRSLELRDDERWEYSKEVVSLSLLINTAGVTGCARGPHLVVVMQAYGLLQHLELIFPMKFTHTYMALEIGSMSQKHNIVRIAALDPAGGCGTDSWQSPTPNPNKL